MIKTKDKLIKDVHKRRAKRDMVILSVLPIVATVVSLIADIPMIVSTILFLVPPAAYLSYRTPSAIKRTAVFALIATAGCAIIDYFAGIDRSWYTYTIFSFRIFNHITVENLVWAYLLIYLIVIFYEHFFDKGRHKIVGHNLKYMIILLFTILAVLIGLQLLLPQSLHYFYVKAGVILLLIPIMGFMALFPKYISILLKTAPYFFGLGLLIELTSVHKGYWYYPGEHFIGYMIIGNLQFPLEEVLFWMLLFSSAVISYFEFFDDNNARLPERSLRKLKLIYRHQ